MPRGGEGKGLPRAVSGYRPGLLIAQLFRTMTMNVTNRVVARHQSPAGLARAVYVKRPVDGEREADRRENRRKRLIRLCALRRRVSFREDWHRNSR
jgi:hypothetical protein